MTDAALAQPLQIVESKLPAGRDDIYQLPPGVAGKAGLSEQQSKDLHRVESGK